MHDDHITGDAISIREVAEHFGVSVRTIREWMGRDPAFPRPFKKFGTLRFSRSDVEKYWAQKTLEPDE
jgi:predicted DNA-binding transcriptional regulator AlpA